jgi:hypothetical protein
MVWTWGATDASCRQMRVRHTTTPREASSDPKPTSTLVTPIDISIERLLVLQFPYTPACLLGLTCYCTRAIYVLIAIGGASSKASSTFPATCAADGFGSALYPQLFSSIVLSTYSLDLLQPSCALTSRESRRVKDGDTSRTTTILILTLLQIRHPAVSAIFRSFRLAPGIGP